MDYGVWTLVPVLLVIVFALKTKRTLESLIFGTMLTYVITNAALLPVEGVDALGHIPSDWMDAFSAWLPTTLISGYFGYVHFFGSLITLLGASHGTLDSPKF